MELEWAARYGVEEGFVGSSMKMEEREGSMKGLVGALVAGFVMRRLLLGAEGPSVRFRFDERRSFPSSCALYSFCSRFCNFDDIVAVDRNSWNTVSFRTFRKMFDIHHFFNGA